MTRQHSERKEPPRPTRAMGDRLRAARETLGLSTQAAAAKAEISPGYLFKLESGYVGTPSPHVLHRLAGVMLIDYWELSELAGYVVPDRAERTEAPSPVRPAGPDRPAQETPLDRIVTVLEGIHHELRELRRQQRTPHAAPVERPRHRPRAEDHGKP